ncbi:hypothetical protein DdX_08718 [Ditylenchus destructor]|uniref:DUF8206 domain-containing protein n=1 Tax=Ditylenchus destructor TaxID=166010 RepID=A0AAD4N3R0_9BILA|nr:hypothetical protein DdX_08718 [Ditylenchus destructor]
MYTKTPGLIANAPLAAANGDFIKGYSIAEINPQEETIEELRGKLLLKGFVLHNNYVLHAHPIDRPNAWVVADNAQPISNYHLSNSDIAGIDTLVKALSEDPRARRYYRRCQNDILNILILGETGVGKSTWINGIANYVVYGSLNEAQMSNDPKWKIPSRFTIADDDYNVRTIYVGPPDGNENEQTKVGASSTLFPQVYEFMWKGQKVRFIDTPGIGDSRGVPQDKVNLANIFRYIDQYQIENLSAVIILMKPNQKVFTPAFTYCIGELFTHLPKSSTQNVLFGFTGTRPFCYRIAETLAPLQQFLATIEKRQNVSLKVNKDTAFCFDNEAFRFLFASLPENGITFTKEDCKNYAASWDQSVKETQRFLNRVRSLPLHDTTEIVSLNEARQYISMLSKPLASITDMIDRNIKSKDTEMQRIMSLDTNSANFKKELTKTHKKVYYVCENLPRPRTVCTSREHTEMVTDEHGTSQVHYTTHCHAECYLQSVTPKTVGDPELQNCAAMAGGPNCIKCGCLWNVHMHVTYKQIMRSEMVETINEDIKRLLSENGDKRKALQMAVNRLLDTVEEYKTEKEEIGRIAAMFGAFLKKNAIMSYNDAVEEYTKLSIQQAMQQAEITQNPDDIEHVETLRDWLNRYKQQKHYIEIGEAEGCKASEVKGYCKKLLNLKHSGRYIKDMFECEKRVRLQHSRARLTRNVIKEQHVTNILDAANFDTDEGLIDAVHLLGLVIQGFVDGLRVPNEDEEENETSEEE